MAFPTYRFDDDSTVSGCDPGTELNDAEEIQCAWLRASALVRGFVDTGNINHELEPALLRFSRAAQGVMSSTASNYDIFRLCVGLFVGTAAVFLSAWSSYGLLSKWRFPETYFIFSILGYGAMMFASSYVEEEQQFWYWVFTGWAFYVHSKSSGRLRQTVVNMGAIGLAICHRVLRRWNQTGQKFAGEPDIARNFLPFHRNILWGLVVLTYADTCGRISFSLPHRLIWRLLPLPVTLAAFTFKLAFVASESPELLNSPSALKYTKGLVDALPLMFQARLVFSAITLLAVFAISANHARAGWLRGK